MLITLLTVVRDNSDLTHVDMNRGYLNFLRSREVKLLFSSIAGIIDSNRLEIVHLYLF